MGVHSDRACGRFDRFGLELLDYLGRAADLATIVMRVAMIVHVVVMPVVVSMDVVGVMPVSAIVTFMVMAQLGKRPLVSVNMGLFVTMRVNRSVGVMFMVAMVMQLMTVMIMMFMFVRIMVAGPMFVRLIHLGWIRTGSLDHGALNALAMAAATRIAMARTAAVGAILGFFLGFTMGALIGFDQRLTIGDRNLIVVRMNFAEGQKAMAVAAIFDEGGLERRLYARHLGEIDVSTQLLALGGLEIKLFDAIAADHDDPGLFRVGSIDQHFVGHFGTLGGGGRVWRCARVARPGDATVHLIRG